MTINFTHKPTAVLFLIWFIVFQFPAFAQQNQAQDPFIGWFLTWKEDPTSSMVVDWHSFGEEGQTFKIRKEGEAEWREEKGKVLEFPFTSPKRWIHRVELKGLEPDSRYDIQLEGQEAIFYFRTMPTDLRDKSIRIAVGGDTMHDKKNMERTGRQAMSFDPDFVVIGGDLAYANGDPEAVGRWYQWFEAYNNSLIASDGRIVPMLVAIGNHEVQKGYYTSHADFVANDENRLKIAPFFYSLFAFPSHPGYGVLDFGKYLSLFLLDTDHTNAIGGEQTDWLAKNLEDRTDVLHLIPIYHVPGFPSVREYEGAGQKRVREHWVPLFEKNGVRLAFENHDHAYKRTHPIWEEKVNEKGIVYVGDGSWGTSPREVHSANTTWYLKKSQSIRAFTILSLEGRGYSLISVDEYGRVIDTYPNNPLHLRMEVKSETD
ncbi:purple acid phosphatase family protein [Anditalea andensis]|uniref:Metallophosphoesterase n=1 Tax=Anditalea andensis TaxID=1048983 RepID=A0A074KWP3_9BACT|nr:metallophosphoesterase family protein [Anditalea andensis]KEO72023.1 metallophosphoesterase [Anditalea andensis]